MFGQSSTACTGRVRPRIGWLSAQRSCMYRNQNGWSRYAVRPNTLAFLLLDQLGRAHPYGGVGVRVGVIKTGSGVRVMVAVGVCMPCTVYTRCTASPKVPNTPKSVWL
jgi:hypothetical protein